jgi:PDDEXK-like domain of unknown function (DUF3799)
MILEPYFDPTQPLPGLAVDKPWGFGVPPREPLAALVSGVPEAQYRAFSALNSSLLKEFTAADMWHIMNELPEDHYGTEAAAWKWTIGNIVHWAVLEQWKFAEFDKHTVMSPTIGLATKKAQDVRMAYPNRLVVTPEIVDLAHQCFLAIKMHPGAQHLLSEKDAERELSGFYYDPDFLVWKKIRIDYAPHKLNYLVDVKTTAKDLQLFEFECKKYGYHIQAAHYLDGWERITGVRKEIYYLIAVTKEPPFKCKIFDFQNFPFTHPLYRQSPLARARDQLGTRQAIWLTAANETLYDLKQGLSLTPEMIRKNWPAHEQDQPFSTTLMYS